jgi:hypothetical protein
MYMLFSKRLPHDHNKDTALIEQHWSHYKMREGCPKTAYFNLAKKLLCDTPFPYALYTSTLLS